jgi:hypothetical protein
MKADPIEYEAISDGILNSIRVLGFGNLIHEPLDQRVQGQIQISFGVQEGKEGFPSPILLQRPPFSELIGRSAAKKNFRDIADVLKKPPRREKSA